METKNKRVQLRLTEKEYNTVKESQLTFSQVFQKGLEALEMNLNVIPEKSKEELEKRFIERFEEKVRNGERICFNYLEKYACLVGKSVETVRQELKI